MMLIVAKSNAHLLRATEQDPTVKATCRRFRRTHFPGRLRSYGSQLPVAEISRKFAYQSPGNGTLGDARLRKSAHCHYVHHAVANDRVVYVTTRANVTNTKAVQAREPSLHGKLHKTLARAMTSETSFGHGLDRTSGNRSEQLRRQLPSESALP